MITEVNIISLVIIFAVILLSMTLHEAMHAFMGYWLGDDTAKREGRLTLNPIKHIDPFLTLLLPLGLALLGLPIFGGAKPVPFNPERVRYGVWGAALIAFAGPLTNFLLAFVTFGIFVLAGLPSADSLGGQILLTTVMVNLGFFIFNMLPIPPLDGSRVLYALAPEFVRRGMEFVERYGVMLVFVLVLLASPLLGRFMLGAIQFFFNLFATIFGVA